MKERQQRRAAAARGGSVASSSTRASAERASCVRALTGVRPTTGPIDASALPQAVATRCRGSSRRSADQPAAPGHIYGDPGMPQERRSALPALHVEPTAKRAGIPRRRNRSTTRRARILADAATSERMSASDRRSRPVTDGRAASHALLPQESPRDRLRRHAVSRRGLQLSSWRRGRTAERAFATGSTGPQGTRWKPRTAIRN